mgnify:CR=1 FL=1|tara:strand:- start:2398 stop:3018 length:621 start_codon:yes stop_codon:yes gene_type:complete
MARKKLLTEGEIRQFMKLANLRPVSKKRLSEYGMSPPGQRDDEMEMEMGAEEEVGMEDDMGGEEVEMDAEVEMDVEEPEAEGGDMVSLDDFMDALEMAIEDVTGEPASVEEVPDEEGGDEEVDMEAEEEIDMGDDMGGGEEMEMGAEEEVVAEVIRRVTSNLKTRSKEDAIVNEVAQRVARRLQRENRQAQMVDHLAERIMKRLTK